MARPRSGWRGAMIVSSDGMFGAQPPVRGDDCGFLAGVRGRCGDHAPRVRSIAFKSRKLARSTGGGGHVELEIADAADAGRAELA